MKGGDYMLEDVVVWVFNGASGQFPSAVFSSKERADEWIRAHHLTGVLTAYPVDISVYDWAIQRGHFRPKKEIHSSPEFIQKFSSATQDHSHYREGLIPGESES
jgi:hypothetical protein